MFAVLRFVAPVLVLFVGGLALTTVADGARWGAVLLHAEPLLWLGMVALAYAVWVRRQRAVALGIVVGVGLGSLALRAPLPPRPVFGEVPMWVGQVRRCAGAVALPREDVTVLVWTVDPGQNPHELVADVVRLAPDLAVLLRLEDAAVVDAVQTVLGGEATHIAREGGGVGVFTKGELPLCGDEHVWTGPEAGPPRFAAVFAKVPSGVTFPVLVGSLPSPAARGDWQEGYLDTVAALGSVAADLGAASSLVIADASATWTYRRLDGALAHAALRPVAMPLSWPAMLGPVRTVPLQPFDRAWVGEAWRARATRIEAGRGSHDPVWIQLSPARRVGAYQRPTSPTPVGDSVRRASTSPTTSPVPSVSPPPANSPPAR